MQHKASRRPPRRSIRKLFILLCIIANGVFFIKRQQPTIISPVPAEIFQESPSQIVLFAKKKDPQELQRLIHAMIGTTWKNYSVLVKDLNRSFEVGISDTVIYEAASVNKISILAALYKKAGEGSVDLNKQITVQAKDIQDYGTGVIRYEKPGGVYSVKTLARLMMQKSDNTAAYILSSYIVSTADIQTLLPTWGLTQTEMVINNQTSNRDMAILLPKLLDGKIVHPALTLELRSFLKDSDFEDRLPQLLPKTATVFHKTGDAIASLHDVGVVEDEKLKYYIGIFTSEISNEEETKRLMAKISKLVYDYLRQ